MDSCQAKIDQKKQRKRENKNNRSVPFHSVPFHSRPVREHSKKIAKKFKKLKNTIMTSFQAKICWKRLRKRENKNYRYVTFLPDSLEKITKKQQKKLRSAIMASFQAKIGWKRQRKRQNKN